MLPLNIHTYTPMTQENTEAQTKLYKALVNFISETTDIHADSVNPFHKSKYASLSKHLEVLKPLLKKHGLAIVQMPIGDEYGVGVRTLIIHTDGGMLNADAIVPAEKGLSGQQAGTIYSYLRRYSLASVCGCATDDDDAELDRQIRGGAKASAPAPVKAKATAPASAPAVASGEEILVPFGDRKGQPLSSLPLVEPNREVKFGDLTYFAKRWTPKPFGDNPNPSARDLKVKAEAQRLFDKIANGDTACEQPTQDEVPF